MKKTAGIILVFLLFGLTQAYGQTIPFYSIPSYNVPVDGYAGFISRTSPPPIPSKGKVDAKIHVRSATSVPPDVYVTVWVSTADRSTLLGPFMVKCGETLTVSIDERQWGVLVECDTNVLVDVWFE